MLLSFSLYGLGVTLRSESELAPEYLRGKVGSGVHRVCRFIRPDLKRIIS